MDQNKATRQPELSKSTSSTLTNCTSYGSPQTESLSTQAFRDDLRHAQMTNRFSTIAFTFSCCLFALLAVLFDRPGMAPLRPKAPTNFGSSQWILSEREQVLHLADQDAEEFAFSARNEVDWLNEHMAEIFDENQLCVCSDHIRRIAADLLRNIAEIFKTPGKLRGKTPRTARKRNALEVRAVSIFAEIS